MSEKNAPEAGSSPCALSEYQSKKLLAQYSIPITREMLAKDRDQAMDAAGEIGFPVVLKACGPSLMHKTEAGGVILNLNSAAEVGAAYDRMMAALASAAKEDLEGVLVAEMRSGQRELVMGLRRDPQFGPCVMVGFGGVMTEIVRDTVFRVAPFDQAEAEDMISELRSRPMLDAFRGEAPADMERLYRCLMALGDIGVAHPEIAEIDINPLKIDSMGQVIAVDALVVFSCPP